MEEHRTLQRFVRDSNRLYCHERALHQSDASLGGFQWIDYQDVDHSITSFVRSDAEGDSCIVVVCNFTPVTRHGYRVGMPGPGRYHQILNSDWRIYGGSGVDNPIPLVAEEIPWQGASWSALMELPPLGVLYWKRDAD